MLLRKESSIPWEGRKQGKKKKYLQKGIALVKSERGNLMKKPPGVGGKQKKLGQQLGKHATGAEIEGKMRNPEY